MDTKLGISQSYTSPRRTVCFSGYYNRYFSLFCSKLFNKKDTLTIKLLYCNHRKMREFFKPTRKSILLTILLTFLFAPFLRTSLCYQEHSNKVLGASIGQSPGSGFIPDDLRPFSLGAVKKYSMLLGNTSICNRKELIPVSFFVFSHLYPEATYVLLKIDDMPDWLWYKLLLSSRDMDWEKSVTIIYPLLFLNLIFFYLLCCAIDKYQRGKKIS